MKKEEAPKVMLLSPIFYVRYADNTEILTKKNRPYLVLLVEYRSLKFAIPFRSNIQHTHAYKFECENAKRTSSGLDFIEGLNKEPLPPKYNFSSLTFYRSFLIKTTEQSGK